MKNRIKCILPSLGCALLCVLLAMGLLSSCISELENGWNPSGSGKGQQEVLLKLRVPGAKQGTKAGTRAVTPAVESTVNDLYILAFKTEGDTFEYWVKAEKGIGDDWTARLTAPEDGHEQNFLVIANAEGTKDNMLLTAIEGLTTADTKGTVREKLLAELTDTEKTNGFDTANDTDHSPFTMCGLTASTVIQAGKTNRLEVNLYRIMARVQVYFGKNGEDTGTGVTNFTPETVSLYNFSASAQVVPGELRQAVTQPSLPAGVVTVKGPATYAVADNKLEYSIYLFETAQPADNTPNQRPCLIIGGKYDGGATTYYRVDLYDGTNYLDVLRNHSYEVTVTGVSAEGAASKETALQSEGQNITAGVIIWDETEVGNIDFDGQNYLGISTLEYAVGKAGGNFTQKVKASAAWTAQVLNENGEGTPDWISIIAGNPGKGGVTETMSFSVTALPEGMTMRTALLRFTLGSLQVDARVVQDVNYSGTGGVFVNVQDVVVITNGNDVTTQIEVEFGPADTDLIWTLGDTPESTGIVLAPDQAMMGAVTGRVGANTTTILVKTNELNSPEITTYKSLLRLSAQGKDGNTASATAELRQSTFKVELSKILLTAYGQGEAKLYVNANAPWTATFDMSQDSRLSKFTSGFVDSQYTGPADAGTANESSIVKFNMLDPEFTEKPVASKVRFATAEGDLCDVAVQMSSAFTDGGTPYEIFQQEMSFADAVANGVTPGEGYQLVNTAQANRIIRAWGTGETWVSDPRAFRVKSTCSSEFPNSSPSVYPFCVSLSESHPTGEPSTLEVNYVLDGKNNWADVGGTLSLIHEGGWGWTDDHKEDCLCHITCYYDSFNADSKEIKLIGYSCALNPGIYTAQKPHFIYPYPEPTDLVIPVVGEGKYRIINYDTTSGQDDNAPMPSNHLKVAKDYLVWKITGETKKNCLFLKPIQAD